MALTKSGARTRVRTRIRDTVTTYEYSDATLDTYLPAALEEIAVAVREVDSDYYLKNFTFRGYDDALDPGTSGTQSYEFYALPPGCASVRWIERISSGIVQYRLCDVSAHVQEGYRYNFGNRFGNGTIAVANGGDTATFQPASGRESWSIHGERVRVVPPPTASGTHTFRLWYDWTPDSPQGESEPLDIPTAFDEALVRAWAQAAVEDDDPALGGLQEKAKEKELAKAKASHRKRTRRNIGLGRAF